MSAGAAAGSSVANVLGYPTVSKILAWIAVGTGLGAGILAARANQTLIIKNFASTAEKTTSTWQRILGGINTVGAIANSFARKPKRRPGQFQTIREAVLYFVKNWNQYSIYKD